MFRRVPPRHPPRRFLLAGILTLATLAGASGAYGQPAEPMPTGDFEDSRRFRRVAFAVHAGFAGWTLSSLESTLDHRAEVLALDGFDLTGAEFPSGAAFGAGLEVRLRDRWFLRGGVDWTRTREDVRDRETVTSLGGRRPVSMTFETRVNPDPFFFTAGAGRHYPIGPGRFAVSFSGILAPMRVEETYEIILDTSSKQTSAASGIGLGGELAASYDYFTDARMNLVAEFFARLGAAQVELDVPARESELVPGERRVDFTGVGVRLGFRWI